MEITVYTNQPSLLIKAAVSLLRQRGADYEEWQNLHYLQFGNQSAIDIRDGESVTLKVLTENQFCAVKDAAVRTGLDYDGSQAEATREGEEMMRNYTIGYVILPVNGDVPRSHSNTITGAPSEEAAMNLFHAVMSSDWTRITSVRETPSAQDFVCPVTYCELEQMSK